MSEKKNIVSKVKESFKMSKHLVVQLVVACCMCIIGCGLLIAGFVVAPLGIIDGSVLVAFGEILTFAGALFGVDYTYKTKFRNQEQ